MQGASSLDAAAFREAMARFAGALREHRDELNSLNVYPIPDGDTGTNMWLTQREVEEELRRSESADLPALSEAISRASLMGARGNSGVILAQALRGMCAVLSRSEPAQGRALADALRRAADEAYRAVATPVEGTVLTVLADAARAAAGAADGGAGAAQVAEAALEEARASVERTREILPELAAAGVVDAGGRGIVLLLDALASVLADRPMSEPVGPFGPVGRSDEAPGPVAFKFEVQLLMDADEQTVAGLRGPLGSLGDSLVVVGGGGTYKVHLHTNEPDRAVALASRAGAATSVTVTDLEGDVLRCAAGQARSMRAADEQRCALVAVADGDGLARVFASLGAVVVRGGPGNNPSVAEILHAIEVAPSGAVVVLPDHENVVPAARSAAGQSPKDVRVVATRSVPQGVAAAAAFNPHAEAGENERALSEAAEACTWGEVTRAVRDAQTPIGPVREGDVLGVAGGEVVLVGRDPVEVAVALVGRMQGAGHEILTAFVGDGAGDSMGPSFESAARGAFPDLEIEVRDGGQPHHLFLIGLE